MADKYIISKSKLTAIADAIRTKTGETGTLTADQMAEKISGIQTGDGDTALPKMLLSGSGGISELDTTSLNITGYRQYAFANINAIYSVKDDNISYIGDYAFNNCYNLSDVNFPKVQTLANSVFGSCYSLKTLSLPLCTSVGTLIFGDAPFENVSIGANATSQISVHNGAFNINNTGSRVITIGGESETSYVTLDTNWVNYATECIIYNCYEFYGSNNVTAFIFPKLYSNYVVPAYYGTAYGTPWYYFPAEYIDQVKAATNWSTVADKIRPLEDLILNRLTIVGTAPNVERTSATYKLAYNDGCYVRGTYKGVTWSVSSNVTIKESSDDSCTIEWANLKEGDTVTITATSTVNPAVTTTQTLTAKDIKQSIKVDTTQWVATGETPTGALTQIYKSDSGSYHVSNGASLAKVTFYGYTKLTVSVRSYAESDYDYVTVSDIDFSGTFSRSSAKILSTKGAQSSSEYTDHTFETDGDEHFFYVLYSKDNSEDNDDDRGYFYIKAGE